MEEQERNRMVRKMLRKQIIGAHKKQVTTVVNFSLPTHERGRGETLLKEMANDPHAPVEWSGLRTSIRASSKPGQLGIAVKQF